MNVNNTGILNELKDFQRLTAKHVFRRLYLDEDLTNRFLVADEVGLGKTLVARGVIAQAVEHLTGKVDRIDVVYVCSNLQIARQNVRRLKVAGVEPFREVDRITLLALSSQRLRKEKVNIVAITPGTSMQVQGGGGWSRERAVLRLMMKKVWGPERFQSTGSMRVFQGGVRTLQKFRGEYNRIEKEYGRKLDPQIVKSFRAQLIEYNRNNGAGSLQRRFGQLCAIFSHARPKTGWTWQERRLRNQFIGDMRELLARASLNVLEPDLIILDEFQRFKSLLAEPGSEGSDPAAELAHELFSFVDDQSNTPAKVLLLSATPYKMLTRSIDDEEDHHADLVDTAAFLLEHDDQAVLQLQQALAAMRRGLLQVGKDAGKAALAGRRDVETILRRIMVRTERLASTREGSGMLVEPRQRLGLSTADIEHYVASAALASDLGAPDPLEYWKSAPYLLNFMDQYVMKRHFEKALAEDPGKLAGKIQAGDLLDWQAIRQYEPIDLPNARIRRLVGDTVDTGTWQLLWIPPSLPYVEPSGPYAEPSVRQLTKRLVFSAWAMVPTMVSSILTYEAERRMVSAGGSVAYQNTPTARATRARLLEFTKSDERLTGMPVFGLIYPSPVLAEVGDQLRLASQNGGRPVPRDQALAATRTAISVKLETLASQIEASGVTIPDSGLADERWYWAAPLWLDRIEDAPATDFFFSRIGELTGWYLKSDKQGGGRRFNEHVQLAQQTMRSYPADLGRPPDDLADVLARLALASPGNAALRSLARLSERSLADQEVRSATCQVAWAFRSLFNGPEIITMVRSTSTGDRYWQQVLDYCLSGNLESVLDEYGHVLVPARGHINLDQTERLDDVAQAMHDAVHLRTVNYSVSEISMADGVQLKRSSMRANFAVRLSDERADDGTNTRVSDVREAFNSPFWPFVLVTTSAGQEGLDFHLYSHAIVHWNLPSNPVDLEQREGRVHRFKGHAIRRNLAAQHGALGIGDGNLNPWDRMFDHAERNRHLGLSDIVPYWVFAIENGASIERHVPVWTLSRDEQRADALKRAVAVYRLAFGQPRQDDLLAYLAGTIDPDELARLAEHLRVDLSPTPRRALQASDGP